MDKLVVFILNYNGMPYIKESLASIVKATDNVSDVETHIVFLDNFSCDGSIEYVQKQYTNITVASTFRNHGYCRGTNIGIQLSYKLYKPNYIMLVDSDNFCEPDAYNELVTYIRNHKEVAMVQPVVKSRQNRGEIISCGHVFNDIGGIISIKGFDDYDDFDNLISCSISATLFRVDALEKVGLLNEIYEMYFESSDISFRLRNNGYKCACCKSAVSYNERATLDVFQNFTKKYLIARNCPLFWLVNDRQKYLGFRAKWIGNYYELKKKFENTDFITDYDDEGLRKGLEGVFAMENIEPEELLKIGQISEFRKEEVILFSM